MAKGKATAISQPIAENRDVKELLSLMEANHIPGAEELKATVAQVAAMEKYLANMVTELAAVRGELAAIREENHPLKTALQKAIITLQGNILELRDKLATLKREIVAGCRHALDAVRDKGLSVLRNVANFFRLQPALEAVRGNIETAIREDDRAINRIDTMSAEYHKAGRALKNIARATVGKETIAQAKSPGKIAKALQAPIRADRRCLMAMGRCVDRAIGAVGRLEKAERKPPVMETVQQMERKVREAQRVTPVRVRSRPEPAHADR